MKNKILVFSPITPKTGLTILDKLAESVKEASTAFPQQHS